MGGFKPRPSKVTGAVEYGEGTGGLLVFICYTLSALVVLTGKHLFLAESPRLNCEFSFRTNGGALEIGLTDMHEPSTESYLNFY